MDISEIQLISKLLFKPLGMKLSSVEMEEESQEYLAHNFQLNGKNIKFRKAKITPTKIGQFVTIWKRNEKGITAPFNISDNIDFYIIATRKEEMFGVFIFPKYILHRNKVLSGENKDGKRGIRVYPPWDLTKNKQAYKTQEWQTKYFINLSDEKQIDLEKSKGILTFLKNNH